MKGNPSPAHRRSCPPLDQLQSIASDPTLPTDDTVVDHLEQCTDCQDTLERLFRDDNPCDGLVGEVKTRELSAHWNAVLSGLVGRIVEATRAEERFAARDSVAPQSSLPEVDGYKILGLIGRGGMGAVYRAIHVQFDRPVAIKILPEASSANPQRLRRFIREMAAIGKLDHPGIVQAYDAADHNSTHCIVMELVQGRNVSDIVRQHGRLSVADSCEIIRQAAVALQHAHDNGLVHRDIKPSNMMVSSEGVVKLLDFGLARLSDDGGFNTSELTYDGQIIGTLDYMSPEQAEGSSQIDAASDIYSLGATLFRLIAGCPLFATPEHQSILAKLNAVENEQPKSLRWFRDDVPEPLDRIVMRMLSKSPEQRAIVPAQIADTIGAYAVGADLSALAKNSVDNDDSTDGETEETQQIHGSVSTRSTNLVNALSDRGDGSNHVDFGGSIPNIIVKTLLAFGAIGLAVVLAIPLSSLLSPRSSEQGNPKNNGPQLVDPLDHAMSPTDLMEIVTSSQIESNSTTTSARVMDPAEQQDPTEQQDAARRSQQQWAAEHGLESQSVVSLPAGNQLQLTLIPPGEFMMGSDLNEISHFWNAKNWLYVQRFVESQSPRHRVQITKPFWMGRCEVTVGQFREFVAATGFETDAERTGRAKGFVKGVMVPDSRFVWHRSFKFEQKDDHPVVNITRNDALAFCRWLNELYPGRMFDLPTEAQWEYAARAGSRSHWYFGNEPEELVKHGWFDGNSPDLTNPVAQLQPNAWGLYDVYGNVWEFCRDRFDTEYYRNSPLADPLGPDEGEQFTIRGGCWNNPTPARTASPSRKRAGADEASVYLGFRVVCTVDTSDSP
ncbi:MAG: SUMF1/EgtB/PvdO family nonheme iron enzyme [Planctomycetales bacterium]|nr:SUMF1/EgtB/PvdO family nonheme iron enzyme [Planctomycetales bacterium]